MRSVVYFVHMYLLLGYHVLFSVLADLYYNKVRHKVKIYWFNPGFFVL